jgi:MFS family permease
MTKKLQLTHSQNASVRDGMWHAAMLGAGENYLIACAIALGASTFQTGVLASLPQLFGALSQVLALSFISRIKNRPKFCAYAAFLQAFTWIPIAAIPLITLGTDAKVSLLILLSVAYFVLGNVVGPIWNSLFGDMVPPEWRGNFFGYRNKWIGLVLLGVLIVSGIFLDKAERLGWEDSGFLALFLFAAFCRFFSAVWLGRMEEPGHVVLAEHDFSFVSFIQRASDSNFVKFVLFVSIFNLGLAIANPFLAIYLLRDVGLSYIEFMIITCGMIASQFLTMQHWGKLADQFGTKRLLNIAGVGLALVPFLWLVSSSFWFLFSLQVYTGFLWAGYILSTSNFIFDAVSPPKRARCIAYYAAINGFAVFIGTSFGGLLARVLPASEALQSPWVNNDSNLLLVFLISGLIRMVILVFLTSFKEVREVRAIKGRDLVYRISYMRPLSGAVFGVLASRKSVQKAKKKPNTKTPSTVEGVS